MSLGGFIIDLLVSLFDRLMRPSAGERAEPIADHVEKIDKKHDKAIKELDNYD